MKACPRITTLAVRWVFNPRIDLSRAFSRPWSHSTQLSSYWPLMCNAAGTSFLITFAKARARSGTTSARASWTDNAAVKNTLAEAMSRRCDTYTSMTWPRWSTAR